VSNTLHHQQCDEQQDAEAVEVEQCKEHYEECNGDNHCRAEGEAKARNKEVVHGYAPSVMV